MSRTENPSRKKASVLRRLLFAFVAIALGLLLVEGFFSFLWLLLDIPSFASVERIVPRQVEALRPGESLESYHSKYDEELGWVHIPGRTIGDFYGPGLNMSINKDGFRGLDDYLGKKPAGTYRVVCVGDSMTMGYGVTDAETYPAQLEKINPSIQVVNMGMGGYSACQCGIWYRRMHSQLDADLVILAIIAEDVGRALENPPQLGIIDGKVEVLNVPVPRVYQTDAMELKARGFSDFLVAHSSTARTFDSLVARKRKSEDTAKGDPLALTAATIVELAELTRSSDRDFAVVLLVDRDELPGYQYQYYKNQREFWVVSRMLEKTASAAGVHYTHLLDKFASLEPDELESMYLNEVYRHYSPQGNQMVAQAINDWLAAEIDDYPGTVQDGAEAETAASN